MYNTFEDMVASLCTSLMQKKEEKEFYDKWATSKARESIWTCNDKSTVKIKDMETSHLSNCINILRRKKTNPIALQYLSHELYYRTQYPELLQGIREDEKVLEKCV